jgi:cyclophilin family peptidyl-prolyl cis-trans isomerase
MSNRKTRDRQLAKLAARRAAARRRKQRQRIIAASVAIALAVGALVFAGIAFWGGGGSKAKAASSPTPPASATPTIVACGGTVPSAAATKKPTFAKPPAMTINTKKTYTATIVTSCGTITAELFAKQAPVTVNNFVFLAKQHFYDGLIFHRIIKDFVVQGGDPQGTGSGGPGYQFKDELHNGLKYDVGTMAMANSGPNTNGSQFFFVVGSRGESLPNSYSIFGKVTKGQDVMQKLAALQTGSNDRPVELPYIEKITIKES